jgi:ABC-type nickel/cobalt efflux system permease component RcnA
MKNFRRVFTSLLTLVISFIFVPAAFAHPLGNFTINHYAGLRVSKDLISIDYVLDMAEIPAFQEIATFDANKNGQADPSEAASYHAAKCASLESDLRLLLNDKAMDIALGSSSIEFPTGAGGLPTLRLTCEFYASNANVGQMTSLSFADHTYSERIGWREIVISADGVPLSGSFASTSISNRLTSYPQDLLSIPLDQRQITIGIDSSRVPQQRYSTNSGQPISSLAGNRSDKFTQLITLENLTLPSILFALLVSFIWGAMHAMTPGHGKTIVGAYLIGSRGTMKHALYLGLTTTITHTLGVFAFGSVTLFAAQYIVPEKLFPWITMLSGLFVVGIGINLFVDRYKSSGLSARLGKLKTNQLDFQPAYSPSTSKIRIESSKHEHQHRYVHVSGDNLTLGPNHSHVGNHHHHGHAHNHDHVDHSHMPPEAITWRNLLGLGISGGLLPCPSALVVLLGAIALNKIGFGMILVLAFSLGLAGALTGIGMIFIYAGKLFQRFPTSGKVLGFLPVLSALFV